MISEHDLSELDPHFRIALERLESELGRELVITSAYRRGDRLSHGRGMAVDIACDDSSLRFLILKAALGLGFFRIGVYNRHVHLDLCTDLPHPTIWLGVSS